jgi:hypothetical protein
MKVVRRVQAFTVSVTTTVPANVLIGSTPSRTVPDVDSLCGSTLSGAKYFSSYARAHRVTISRNGSVVTTLDIPDNVYLSVYSDQDPVRTGQDGRVEFHGNVEIRTLPRGDAIPGNGNDATQLMARAPLVIAAQNVDVVSETLIP